MMTRHLTLTTKLQFSMILKTFDSQCPVVNEVGEFRVKMLC